MRVSPLKFRGITCFNKCNIIAYFLFSSIETKDDTHVKMLYFIFDKRGRLMHESDIFKTKG